MAIRLGLVGGGPGAFIGSVHRIAAERARPDGIGMIAIATPIRDHVIRVAPHAFDDFAAARTKPAANRRLPGIARASIRLR